MILQILISGIICLLKPGTDYKALQAKFDAFSKHHFQGDKISGSDEKFLLQPLLKSHLYSDYEYEIGKTGAQLLYGECSSLPR